MSIYLSQGISGDQLMTMKGLKAVTVNGKRCIVQADQEPTPELVIDPPKRKRRKYVVRQSKMNE